MIEFLRPEMLIGLLAGGIPVAIHLLGRRQAEVVQFSALAFLLEQNPLAARGIWMREKALLALRVMAVALIAVALSKPMIPGFSEGSDVVAADAPVAIVFVLDDSLTMGTQDSDGVSRFGRAVQRGRQLLRLLPVGSEAAVVASGYPARLLNARLTTDLQAVGEDMAQLRWFPRRDDPERALELADQLLAASAQPDKRVVILSDLQRSSWQRFAPRGDAAIRVAAEPIDHAPAANTAIVRATVEAAVERGPRYVRVTVHVRHVGSRPFAGHVTVRAGEREITRWLELADGQTAQRSVVLNTDAPAAVITLPPDDLPADNALHVLLDSGTGLSIAMINGAPRPVPREDEVFFAAQALRLGSARGDVLVDVYQPAQLADVAWKRYHAIVLANVAELPDATQTAIGAAVEAGAGLLVTAGDGMPLDGDGWPAALLPWRLAGKRELTGSAASGVVRPAEREDKSGLFAAGAAALAAAKHAAHVLVEPSVAAGEATVLRLSDGAPALLIGARGRGRVGLWTTTIDRDWSDVALQPGFLPLVTGTMRHLAEAALDQTPRVITTAEAFTAQRHKDAKTLIIRGKSELGESVEALDAAAQPTGQWRVRGPAHPGYYELVERSDQTTWTTRSVVVQPAASELDPGPLDDPARWRNTAAATKAAPARPKTPGWPLVLVLVLGVMLLEGAVVWRVGWGQAAGASQANGPRSGQTPPTLA